jgi:hypothetical protein
VPNLIPVLIGLFVLAALLRIDTYFSLVYLLAVAYVLGRFWSRQSMKQLRTERRLVSRAFPGETIAVELRVSNDGWLPVAWVEMHDSLPAEMASPPTYRRVLTMMPHEERRFGYALSASKRGYYRIGPMTWRTGDLLGFAPQQTAHHRPETIIVYPRVVSLERLGLPTRSPLASIRPPRRCSRTPPASSASAITTSATRQGGSTGPLPRARTGCWSNAISPPSRGRRLSASISIKMATHSSGSTRPRSWQSLRRPRSPTT